MHQTDMLFQIEVDMEIIYWQYWVLVRPDEMTMEREICQIDKKIFCIREKNMIMPHMNMEWY